MNTDAENMRRMINILTESVTPGQNIITFNVEVSDYHIFISMDSGLKWLGIKASYDEYDAGVDCGAVFYIERNSLPPIGKPIHINLINHSVMGSVIDALDYLEIKYNYIDDDENGVAIFTITSYDGLFNQDLDESTHRK